VEALHSQWEWVAPHTAADHRVVEAVGAFVADRKRAAVLDRAVAALAVVHMVAVGEHIALGASRPALVAVVHMVVDWDHYTCG
jgi:hypothetical protein